MNQTIEFTVSALRQAGANITDEQAKAAELALASSLLILSLDMEDICHLAGGIEADDPRMGGITAAIVNEFGKDYDTTIRECVEYALEQEN